MVDETGIYSHVGQRSDVWFLAGRFGRSDKVFPHRKCTVPAGLSILFPILNCEANQLEYPHLQSEQDLIDHVTRDVNTIVAHQCLINGEPIIPFRTGSEPHIFQLRIAEDNVMEIKWYGTTNAAADGYWIFLKPMPKGEYHLRFQGSCEAGRLSAGASYDLIIA